MGLVYRPFLLFIALFVWLGATQEAALTRMNSAVGGIPVHQLMVNGFQKTIKTDVPRRVLENNKALMIDGRVSIMA
jgi:hypothetical protein